MSFYIPYQASPTSGTAGGTTGLFVIPSDNLSAQPLFVTTDSGSSLAAIYQFSLNSAGYITGYTPFGIVYNDLLQQHLYRLDLGIQSGNAPALVQMSTLSFSQTKVCEMSIIVRTNFTDPLTTAFIFRVAANGSPCGAADQFLMVHYTDSATTAPVTVPSAPMGAIYNSDGSLAGLLALDASGNLKFYKDLSFTNPKQLLSGLSGCVFYSSLGSEPSSPQQATGDAIIGAVKTTSGYSVSLYHVDGNGNVSGDLYDSQLNGGINSSAIDSHNLYFTDSSAQTNSTVVARLALDGNSKATTLYTTPPRSAQTIIGVSGSQLILLGTSSNSAQATPILETLATGTPGTPSTVATLSSGVESANMIGGYIFVTSTSSTGIPSIEIFQPDGTMLRSNTNSAFASWTPGPYLQLPNFLVELEGLTQPHSYGGSAPYFVSVPTLASTALQTPGGPAYSIPNNASDVYFVRDSPTIGSIEYPYLAPETSALYDISKNLIVPLSLPNTDITPALDAAQ